MTKLYKSFLDSLYPSRCPLCGDICLTGNFHEECYAKLNFVTPPICEKCGKQVLTKEKKMCGDCQRYFDKHNKKIKPAWTQDPREEERKLAEEEFEKKKTTAITKENYHQTKEEFNGIKEINEFGLDAFSDELKQRWKNVSSIVICENAEKLYAYVVGVIKNNYKYNAKAYLGEIGKESSDRIKKETGIDVFHKSLVVDASGMEHSISHHGDKEKEEKRNQIAIRPETFLNIPNIVCAFDEVHVNRYGNLRFTKNYYKGKMTLDTTVSERKLTVRMEDLWYEKRAYSTTATNIPYGIDAPDSESRSYVGSLSFQKENSNNHKKIDDDYLYGRAALNYDEAAQKMVVDLKYNNKRQIGNAFGEIMADKFDEEIKKMAPDCLIPVPISPERLRDREYNQSTLICRAMTRRTGVPTNENILIRNKKTVAQKKLGPEMRQKNLANAIEIAEKPPKTVILVDDIYTTGATIRACTAALKAGGAENVYFLACCIGSER